MAACNLCPRGCNADRQQGKIGYCGVSGAIRVARASLHMWEEPPISGTNGSGTVFFTGCALRCVYCQNRKIALADLGETISVSRLAEIFLKLQEKQAHNINLVTPSHYVPQIVEALGKAKQQGLVLPVVYNTGSYEKVETLRMLEGLVDIYLPDCKYYNSELSARYSNAPDYFEVASAAIAEMVRQVGTPVFEGELLKRGVVVRHMILPGNTKDSKAVLKYLHDTYGDDIYISIMNQYTPLEAMKDYPEINRRITQREYKKVIDYALSIGIENAFIQEGETAKESFIPDFEDSVLL
ncbi:MAG: radical SAM protein [Lachnospiraceae bacterium]|nr:radical SAM protein [Lachnospiraceae bacterium]